MQSVKHFFNLDWGKAFAISIFILIFSVSLISVYLLENQNKKLEIIVTFYPSGPLSRYTSTSIVNKSVSAYKIKQGNKYFISFNNQNGEKYDWIGNDIVKGMIVFSGDKKKLAYIAGDGDYGADNRFVVLVNGHSEQRGKKYNNVGNIIFSPDSNHLAYIAEDKGKQMIVLNNKEEKVYDKVTNLVFDFSNKQLAYEAKEENYSFIVNNSLEGKKYDWNKTSSMFPVFSSKGKLAYKAHENGQDFIVVDGIEGKKYSSIKDYEFSWMNSIIFSPDGNNLAYVVSEKNSNFIVLNDQELEKYDSIRYLSFTSNSEHLIYVIADSEAENRVIVMRDNEEIIKLKLRKNCIGDICSRSIIYLEETMNYIQEQGDSDVSGLKKALSEFEVRDL
ncbi:MAG: hypothetical protein KAS78_04635 [Candidatus Pacebacteria bacterium]|nr:hypothetical protein [Candidatus Paceibacterota bacterium]